MENALFEVIKPGLATTVQDLGRVGFQQYGVVVSGAMDSFSLQIANILVGNERHEACLEVAILGPKLAILKDTVLAICGANLSPKLDGVKVPLWKTFRVNRGQILEFGKPKTGVYAYIAVAGGINVPLLMESKSTYTKAKMGGYKGRALEKGDIIRGHHHPTPLNLLSGRGIIKEHIPNYLSQRTIKVILGPDHHVFTSESIYTFFTEMYEVTNQSDRMGYRLTGPTLYHKESADIISDAILPGTIQVPAGGEPIVLLADRQTSGGYPRIATVISSDIHYVAQTLPGEKLCFEQVSVEMAQKLYIEQEKLIRTLNVTVF